MVRYAVGWGSALFSVVMIVKKMEKTKCWCWCCCDGLLLFR